MCVFHAITPEGDNSNGGDAFRIRHSGPIKPEVESAGAHITILEKCANEVPIVESALYISNKV